MGTHLHVVRLIPSPHGLGTKLTLHVNNNFELCVNHAFWENFWQKS